MIGGLWNKEFSGQSRENYKNGTQNPAGQTHVGSTPTSEPSHIVRG